jgi:hypothetical protein
MTVDEAMVRRLWGFVHERQEVRYRRHHLHRKPPWTDDPVLRDNHFTNVFREDDPGTAYVVEHMLLNTAMSFTVAAWNIMWYRMFGKEATWEAWRRMWPGKVFCPDKYDVSMMEKVMRSMVAESGEGPFTGAYMVSNYGRSEDKVTVMVDIMKGAAAMWFSEVDPALRAAAQKGGDAGRRDAHAVLQRVHGVGNFVAFQTLVDLSYPVLPGGMARMPFSNDDWATCGPGAERGLLHCVPGTTKSEWNDALAMLVERSHDALAARGFWWRQDADGNDQPLDRANMCNCLCEFSKYVRLSAGEAKGRRRNFDGVESYKRDRAARGHGEQLALLPK